ncbi:MAG: hypothetical protein EON60_06020 [Alphaproteobacteria bacterium]|nr:MAG: hypothetical protein EON60_06020 [Alphaproteobacteria bacterium]
MRVLLALFLLLPVLATAENIQDRVKTADLSKPTKVCGDVLYFDFHSDRDGPAYYTDKDGFILCHAGGQCRGPKAEECRTCIAQLKPNCPQ